MAKVTKDFVGLASVVATTAVFLGLHSWAYIQ